MFNASDAEAPIETSESCGYYSFLPHPNVRIIVLDSYDISMLGRNVEHMHHKLAKQLLDTRNHNEIKTSPTGMYSLLFCIQNLCIVTNSIVSLYNKIRFTWS